jgi:glyoxylate/hydroxypyruvate reductase A
MMTPMRLLFCSHLDDPNEWIPELKRHMPDLEIEIWPQVKDPAAVDAILVWIPPEDGLGQFSSLKAIQSLGAGVNQLDLTRLPRGVPVARLVDPGLTVSMRDYCVWAVLRHYRRLDLHAENQPLKKWVYYIPPPKSAVSVGVMGLGELGGEVARAVADLGFSVRGWARSPKTIDRVECFSGSGGLAAFAARTDILICLLPLTPETRGILARPLFEMLPKGARLINVGRGDHLVEPDLLAALESGRIARATLDVFSREPLPPEHPFWSHPKVTVTPHVAAFGSAVSAAPVVVENLRRAVARKPLLNQVDIERGY